MAEGLNQNLKKRIRESTDEELVDMIRSSLPKEEQKKIQERVERNIEEE